VIWCSRTFKRVYLIYAIISRDAVTMPWRPSSWHQENAVTGSVGVTTPCCCHGHRPSGLLLCRVLWHCENTVTVIIRCTIVKTPTDHILSGTAWASTCSFTGSQTRPTLSQVHWSRAYNPSHTTVTHHTYSFITSWQLQPYKIEQMTSLWLCEIQYECLYNMLIMKSVPFRSFCG